MPMAQLNPLDLPGPAFLALYLILAICGLVVAILFRRFLVAVGEDSALPMMRFDAYEAAYLSGGDDAALDTAIAMLVQRQALKAEGASRSLAVNGPLPRNAHAIEQAVYNAVTPSPRSVLNVRAAARWSVEQVGERLTAMGLILTDARWAAARTIPALIMAAVMVLGILKISVGISRHRPVAFLVILTIITAIVVLIFFFARPRLTPLGERALMQLRLDNAALHATARSRPQMLAPTDMAFAIGLFGVASLPFVDTTWTELRQTLNPPPSVSSGSSSSSGCGSSSSCSSGSSCGGGCGGGCGGCGGG